MRILVISDIHANLAALDTVLSDANALAYDAVWCLGDVVGYGPDPNDCIARLRELPVDVTLAGNHDWATVGRMPIDDFNGEARRAVLWTRAALDPDKYAYLKTLPDTPVVQGDVTLTHGSPRYPVWEYILDAHIALVNFAYFSTRCCFVGHTHVPVIYRWQPGDGGAGTCRALPPDDAAPFALAEAGCRYIVNPGSVGQPRDSDPRASYALFDTETMAWHYRRVAYPIEVTQSRMRQAGLPERLIARLSFGW